MLFEAIERINNIDYKSQYVVEVLFWLDSVALGAIVGLIMALIIYLFEFTIKDLYNEDYLLLFVVFAIIILGIGNCHTKMNYKRYLDWINRKNKQYGYK